MASSQTDFPTRLSSCFESGCWGRAALKVCLVCVVEVLGICGHVVLGLDLALTGTASMGACGGEGGGDLATTAAGVLLSC